MSAGADDHLDEIDVTFKVTVRAHVEDEQDRETVQRTVEQAVRDGLDATELTITAVAVEDTEAEAVDAEE